MALTRCLYSRVYFSTTSKLSKETLASKTYDLTPKEREIIEWRAQRRRELRNEYLKEVHNPNHKIDGVMFDPQVQRQYTAYFSYEEIWKPTIKNFLWFGFIIFGSWTALYKYVKKYRDEAEHKYRTGQVSYRDREAKFV